MGRCELKFHSVVSLQFHRGAPRRAHPSRGCQTTRSRTANSDPDNNLMKRIVQDEREEH
jgi:hypothetical protein